MKKLLLYYFTLCLSYLWFSLSIAFINSYIALAQCSETPPAIATCSSCTTIVSSTNMTTGSNFCLPTATTATVSSLNIDGGTLRVCGNLTISSWNTNINNSTFNLIIEQGATLTVNAGFNVNNQGAFITNRGVFNMNSNLTLQASGTNTAVIYNAATGVINMGSNNLTLNSDRAKLINLGTINAGQLTVQCNTCGGSNGAVCLGASSTINVSNLVNNVTNSFHQTGGAGRGCLRFTGNANLNNNLTTGTQVGICGATGSTVSPANWGSAFVQNNCGSCAVLLPLVGDMRFLVLPNQSIQMHWEVQPADYKYLVVERWLQDQIFEPICQLDYTPNQNKYSCIDAFPLEGRPNAYRLKQVYQDNSVEYSQIYQAPILKQKIIEDFYPNPAIDHFWVNVTNPNTKIEIWNILGNVVLSQSTTQGLQKFVIDFLVSGIYLVHITTPKGSVVQKLIKH